MHLWRVCCGSKLKCKVIRKICLILIYIPLLKPSVHTAAFICVTLTPLPGIQVMRTAENQLNYSRMSACTMLCRVKMLPLSAHSHTEAFPNICKVIVAIYHRWTLKQRLLGFLAQILCFSSFSIMPSSAREKPQKQSEDALVFPFYAIYYEYSANISSRKFFVSIPNK